MDVRLQDYSRETKLGLSFFGATSALVLLISADIFAQKGEVSLSSPPALGVSVESDIAVLMDPYDYDARGRRDPFTQPIEDKPIAPGALHGPVLPLQRFDLEQLRLVGIIWDVRKPRAMIRDPKGQTYIVGPNAKLGSRNGYIESIREGEIVVIETIEQEGQLISTSQVVKITK